MSALLARVGRLLRPRMRAPEAPETAALQEAFDLTYVAMLTYGYQFKRPLSFWLRQGMTVETILLIQHAQAFMRAYEAARMARNMTKVDRAFGARHRIDHLGDRHE